MLIRPFVLVLLLAVVSIHPAGAADDSSAARAVAPADTSDYLGSWEGTLALGPTELRVVFHIEQQADTLSATMDSPDQGATGIPVPDILIDADTLRLGAPSIAGMFAGVYDPSGPSIDGQWVQGGRRFPLTLRPTASGPTVRRPQTPEPPFPYTSTDIAFENERAGITLAGTLTRPSGSETVPGVVLVSGSGAQDRNGTVVGHETLHVLADALTRRGIAVLRFDERGVGASEGQQAGSTTEDLSYDVQAAVQTLAARTDIGEVGIVGHSEGGLIAPMVSNRTERVDFVVLLAASARPGKDVILDQADRIGEVQGMAPEARAVQRGTQERVFQALALGSDSAKVASDVKRILRGTQGAPDDARVDAEVRRLMDPWFRFFLDYDPAPALRRLDVPTLALYGTKDLQVAPDPNADLLRRALQQGANPPHTVNTIEGANHLFQMADTGAPNEYARIEQTMAPGVMKRIASWILNTTK